MKLSSNITTILQSYFICVSRQSAAFIGSCPNHQVACSAFQEDVSTLLGKNPFHCLKATMTCMHANHFEIRIHGHGIQEGSDCSNLNPSWFIHEKIDVMYNTRPDLYHIYDDEISYVFHLYSLYYTILHQYET